MENIQPLLRSNSLITGIEDDARRVLLSELGAVIRSYGKETEYTTGIIFFKKN